MALFIDLSGVCSLLDLAVIVFAHEQRVHKGNPNMASRGCLPPLSTAYYSPTPEPHTFQKGSSLSAVCWDTAGCDAQGLVSPEAWFTGAV